MNYIRSTWTHCNGVLSTEDSSVRSGGELVITDGEFVMTEGELVMTAGELVMTAGEFSARRGDSLAALAPGRS